MEKIEYRKFTSRPTGNNVRYVKMHYCGLLLIRGDYVLIQERPAVKKVYFNQVFESNYGQHNIEDMTSGEIGWLDKQLRAGEVLSDPPTPPEKPKPVKKLEFILKGKANKYEHGVAVDTDGLALTNDDAPHKAYTLEEGGVYEVHIYKIK